MSCVYLHLGQAGNQIGKEFWGIAEAEFIASRRPGRRRASSHLRGGGDSLFHAEDGFSRCLAVDSEPKVVQCFQRESSSLRPENVIFDQGGLANNWAMGFHSCLKEGGLLERCLDKMRKEVERCCWLNSIVLVHSLAGGTGSGLGSALLQALRDHYPSLYLIPVCIGAFRAGDTPLQQYNSALALHHLQVFADAVIYRGNDDMLSQACTSSPTAPHHAQVHDMNLHFASDLASYFFPTSPCDFTIPRSRGGSRSRNGGRGRGRGGAASAGSRGEGGYSYRPFDGGSLVVNACPLPAAKFVDLRSTASILGQLPCRGLGARVRGSPSLGGQGLLAAEDPLGWGKLAGMLGKGAPLQPGSGGGGKGDACLAAHHLLRGVGGAGALAEGREVGGGKKGLVEGAAEEAAKEVGLVLQGIHHCSEEAMTADVSRLPAFSSSKVRGRCLTTVCNQTRVRGVFDTVLEKAEEKFRARAYLHWYERYGLEDEDFLVAFDGLREMGRGYTSLAKALVDARNPPYPISKRG